MNQWAKAKRGEERMYARLVEEQEKTRKLQDRVDGLERQLARERETAARLRRRVAELEQERQR